MLQNPLMLWGLLALAIPVVVHLFNFRRPRLVLFSRAVLFSTFAQFVQRRLKLLRIVLLVLRLAVVALLVVLFAGPVFRIAGGAAANAESRVLILLDNTPSMQRTNELGPYWQQALQTAQAIVKQRTDGRTQFQVQPVSGYRQGQPYVSARLALDALARQRLTDNSITAGQLLARIQQDIRLRKETGEGFATAVYLISDYQPQMLADTVQANWPDGTQLLCVAVGTARPAVYLQTVTLADPVLEADKAPILRVAIQNERSQAAPATTIRIQLAGSEVARGSVDVPANGNASVDIALPAVSPGWQTGQVQIDEDAQGYASTRFFSVYIPPARKLLIVGERLARDYLKQALQTAYTDPSLTFITPQSLDATALAQYDAVILNGTAGLSSSASDRLTSWVHAGGGLLLFPSQSNTAAEENECSLFIQKLGSGTFSAVKEYDTPMEANLTDRAHPLLRPLFVSQKDKAGQMEGFAVRKLFAYTLPTGQVASELLRTTDGQTVLAEVACKKGRVFVAAVPPVLTWSEWPLHHSFAPLIYRMASVLSQRSDTQLEYTLGQTADVRFATAYTDLVVMYKDKAQVGLPQQFAQNGEVLLNFTPLELQAGAYNLMQRDSLLGKVAFNINAQEATGAVATEAELRAYLGASGISGVQFLHGKPEAVAAQATELLGGIVLWKYFLIFALLLLITEGLLARYGIPMPKAVSNGT